MDAQSDDEREIIAVIHANRVSMWTQDFAVYENCFVHAPYTTRWNASRMNGVFVRHGWDDISARVRHQFEDKSMYFPQLGYETKVLNLQLRISGDMAWATFNQSYENPPPPYPHGPVLSNEVRVFEKHDGRWRIAFLGFLDDSVTTADTALLRLNADATIVWKSPRADEALAEDDDLMVRNGRLRIRDSRTDQKLQAALKWAAGRDLSLVTTRGALPIVLDVGEGAPAKVWWVIAESGMILFALNDPSFGEQRLAGAAVVYGLSPAQHRVAGFVAQGLSLAEIAKAMGITPNTARTHLNRIFEKTGVRTQPALVRVLLSAAAPV